MFSSNQKFTISGSMDQLQEVIDFGVRLSGHHECLTRRQNRCGITFQVSPSGLYCIGIRLRSSPVQNPAFDGWTEFPFDYDPAILANIIRQWLQQQPAPQWLFGDGSNEAGFLCRSMASLSYEETLDIKNGLSGILAFSPFNCFYAK